MEASMWFMGGYFTAIATVAILQFIVRERKERRAAAAQPWTHSVEDPIPPRASSRIVTRSAASNPGTPAKQRRARMIQRRR